jgi:uncharacterized protein
MAQSVIDAENRHRFELTVDGELVGYLQYRRHEGVIDLIHTQVLPEYEGKGYAAVLARSVLDGCRADGLKIIPTCPYIAHFLTRHPEYDDLRA